MRKVIVLLAEGFEEIEAVTPIDFLRRGGVEVYMAGVTGSVVKGSHGISLTADGSLSNAPGDADAIVIPGGMPGAENLACSTDVLNLIESVFGKGGLVAAICASPGVVLGRLSVLNHRKATCYPGFQEHFPSDAVYSDASVVIDDNLITGRGVGSAAAFALEILRYLSGDEAADNIARAALI